MKRYAAILAALLLATAGCSSPSTSSEASQNSNASNSTGGGLTVLHLPAAQRRTTAPLMLPESFPL